MASATSSTNRNVGFKPQLWKNRLDGYIAALTGSPLFNSTRELTVDLKACGAPISNFPNPAGPDTNSLVTIDDRLWISFPFCCERLRWEILFDAKSEDAPPDFLFEEGDEFFVNFSSLKYLNSWKPESPSALLEAATEILNAYKKHQERLLVQLGSDLLQREYSTIQSIEGLEIMYKKNEGEWRWLIPLNFSHYPVALANDKPKLLLVYSASKFPSDVPEGTLILPPSWKKALGNVRILPMRQDLHLMENICATQDTIAELIDKYLHRKNLCKCLMEQIGTPSEYDSIQFKKITFLVEVATQPFMIQFVITSTYPAEKPALHLISPGHVRNGKPVTASITSYPYSPRWDAPEMASRMRAFLSKTILQFKKTCEDEALGL